MYLSVQTMCCAAQCSTVIGLHCCWSYCGRPFLSDCSRSNQSLKLPLPAVMKSFVCGLSQLLSVHHTCCTRMPKPVMSYFDNASCEGLQEKDNCLIKKVNSVRVLTAEDTQNVIAALPPQQVIYFQASVDTQNRTLDASTGNNYTITFPLPLPAQAFWSLTLYNATSLNLIVNPINRYTINDRVSCLRKVQFSDKPACCNASAMAALPHDLQLVRMCRVCTQVVSHMHLQPCA